MSRPEEEPREINPYVSPKMDSWTDRDYRPKPVAHQPQSEPIVTTFQAPRQEIVEKLPITTPLLEGADNAGQDELPFPPHDPVAKPVPPSVPTRSKSATNGAKTTE